MGASELINNLKDIILRNMKVMGIITEEDNWDYLLVTYKSVGNQYWKERDLPLKERAIYSMSFTDQGLRDQQQQTLKKFKDEAKTASLKVKDCKQTIKDWWRQRAEEAGAEHDPGPSKSKLNGKK